MSEGLVFAGKYVKVRLEEGREVVERADCAAVLALNENGQMLIVRQHRPAAGLSTAEIPAGLLEEGEAPSVAALREFREETGFAADLTPLGSMWVAPGFCRQQAHLFLAERLREAPLPPDPDEDISIEWLLPEEVLKLPHSAITAAAAFWAMKQTEGER